MKESSIYLSVSASNCTSDFAERAQRAGADGLRLIAKGESPEKIADIYVSTKDRFPDSTKVLLDLPGTKPRLAPDVQATIKPGQVVTFASEETHDTGLLGTRNLADYIKDISRGDRLIINDGSYVFEVVGSSDKAVDAKLLNEEPIALTPSRSINLPDSPIQYKPLSSTDKHLLQLLAEEPDLAVAVSMIGTANDVEKVRALIPSAVIIPKVETQTAISNLDEIVQSLRREEGIMLARGDLSVELSPIEIVRATWLGIEKSKQHNRRLLLATWVLESMAFSGKPSPDGITDVLYFYEKGVRDFVISGEPAVSNPFETVQQLRIILDELEK